MKIFRKALRSWIAIASVFSFLGGWVLLAHSPKPVQPTSANTTNLASLPNVSPFGAFGDDDRRAPSGSGLSPFVPNSQPGTGTPLLRTRGS